MNKWINKKFFFKNLRTLLIYIKIYSDSCKKFKKKRIYVYIARNISETCVLSTLFYYFLKKKHEK